MVRSEFAYYVPRTFNRTVPAYRTSVHILKRTVRTFVRYVFFAYRTFNQSGLTMIHYSFNDIRDLC